MKQEKEKKENCPLCQVSQETLGRLKKRNEEKKPRKFKPWSWLLIIVLVVGGFIAYKVFSNSSPPDQVVENVSDVAEIGSLAPDFILEDTDGNEVVLSSFRKQKPVLLVFWATYCGVCEQELPYLKAFYRANKDDLEIFGIVSGEARWAIKDYIKKEDVSFPILFDDNRKVWKKYLVRGVPSHFLIDMDGKIIAAIPGFASDYDLKMMFQSPL